MIIRKLSDKKPKILIFNGSPRRLKSCANQTSKSQKIVQYVIEKWLPFVDFDVIDLSIGKTTIQPCKGCVSTSNGFHCHFPCSCYVKGDKVKTDLMYEKDVYQKLQECDGFIVVSPIHWYSVSTQVKAMFDRLVCVNQTITQEQAVELFGKGNTKNAELTGKTEIWGQNKDLLKNHLEGKWAAFFVHGDNGANDYDGHQPETGDRVWDVKNSVMPLVYQCRYSGINCPDDLVEAFYINQGKPYYQANEDFDSEISVFKKMDNLVEKLLNYLK
jgi:multimeric flavodoxin WrbA